VQGRPGVSSTILGARTLAQLDDNLDAIDVALAPEQRQRLDALSEPALNFPAPFLKMAPTFAHGGTTVNGVPSMVWPAVPKSDSERY
jgi:hypothetical protein